MATAFGVPRATLDHIAGYPVGEANPDVRNVEPDPEREAEIGAYLTRYRSILEDKLPPGLWRSYMEACEALANELDASFEGALVRVRSSKGRNIGFNMKD
jgi:hypothetical protein